MSNRSEKPAGSLSRRALPGLLGAALAVCGMATRAKAELSLFGPKEPPECDTPAECRFVSEGMTVTLMNCGAPVYGRSGEAISIPRPCNTATTSWRCLACGKNWQERQPA